MQQHLLHLCWKLNISKHKYICPLPLGGSHLLDHSCKFLFKSHSLVHFFLVVLIFLYFKMTSSNLNFHTNHVAKGEYAHFHTNHARWENCRYNVSSLMKLWFDAWLLMKEKSHDLLVNLGCGFSGGCGSFILLSAIF